MNVGMAWMILAAAFFILVALVLWLESNRKGKE
jgi:hypothetical protein